MRFSTGAVRDYFPCGVGPDLPLTIPEAANFRVWYQLAETQLLPDGRTAMSGVWTFAMAPTTIPAVAATCRKCISIPARHLSEPAVRSQSRFPGCLRQLRQAGHDEYRNPIPVGQRKFEFCFLTPVARWILVSLGTNWFPTFRGMHVATGHRGTSNADTLDSVTRGQMFAAYSSGAFFFFLSELGSAWMATGTIDIESGCSAVVIAAGQDRDEAIDRRENEHVHDNRPNPIPNWFAWRWPTR